MQCLDVLGLYLGGEGYWGLWSHSAVKTVLLIPTTYLWSQGPQAILDFYPRLFPRTSYFWRNQLRWWGGWKLLMNPTFIFQAIPIIMVGHWTQESHRHHHTASIAASAPCPFSGHKGVQTPIQGVCKLWYYSENAICYLQCHLELLVRLFASVLQAALILTDPGWTQFRSVKIRPLWHSKQQKHLMLLVLVLLESWQHSYLPVLSGCTTAVCAIRFHSSCSSRDSLSSWVPWKLLNARKINEKIPPDMVGLSSYPGCPGVTPECCTAPGLQCCPGVEPFGS